MTPVGACRGPVAAWRRWTALLLWALVVAWGLAAGPAQAELRALLVGVSSYPSLPAERQLVGPRNDVLQMQKVLQQRGLSPAHTTLLADGVPGAGQPTRANILAALARLATQAERGDTVYLHFSGHGSQQPASPGAASARLAEAGRAREPIFLPQDIGQWDGSLRSVTNAIRASELREAVDRISARGAFVWAVFDVCHAARLVRGGDTPVQHSRFVEAESLGVPAAELAQDSSGQVSRGGAPADAPGPLAAWAPGSPGAAASGPGPGGSALFYAAQAGQQASELLLPAGQPVASRQGLFSHVIVKALTRSGEISYRQLAQYVLAEYRGMVDARATPLFAGNGLDTQVLGHRSLRLQQWPLQVEGSSLWIPAGGLSGLGPGALLAVLPDALAASSAALGYLGVKTVQDNRSELVPQAHAGQAAPSRASLRTGQTLRLVSGPLDFDLHIAVDRRGCASACVLDEVVARLRRDGVRGVAAVWLAEGAGSADVVLAEADGRIVLMPSSALAGDKRLQADMPGVALHEAGRPRDAATLSQQVAGRLHAVARSRNLLRVAASILAKPQPPGLLAELQARAVGVAQPTPVRPGATPALRAGDALVLTVGNQGLLPLDVTVLYLDAAHGVLAVFPDQAGGSNRLDPGDRHRMEIEVFAPPTGVEHLLVIAVEGRRLAEPRDYSFLQQPPLTKRQGADSAELDAFADAVFADHRTRTGATPAPVRAATTVQLFSLSVQP